MSVRLGRPGDAAPLEALVAQSLTENDRRGSPSQRAQLFSDPSEVVVERLLSAEGTVAFVAERSDRLVGFAVLDPGLGMLLAVFVEPTARRQGVATALVAAVSAHLTAEGRAITAVVSAGDRAEKSLFEHLGYRAELLVMAPHERE